MFLCKGLLNIRFLNVQYVPDVVFMRIQYIRCKYQGSVSGFLKYNIALELRATDDLSKVCNVLSFKSEEYIVHQFLILKIYSILFCSRLRCNVGKVTHLALLHEPLLSDNNNGVICKSSYISNLARCNALHISEASLSRNNPRFMRKHLL